MAFTAQDVAKLRALTGAGMMDCKNALSQTNGDMDKAAKYLREQGINIAKKKEGRIASEGIVSAAVSANGKIGALAEINCESDFVAKSAPFIELCETVAKVVVKQNPQDIEALKAEKTADGTVLDSINNATAKIGEKLSLRRFARQEIKCGLQDFYLHMGGKIGVLLEVETGKDINKDKEFTAMFHDVAMHIAAYPVEFISDKEIPASEIEEQKSIFTKQVLNEGKPAAVADKIVAGKLKKYFAEICLLEQPFVKDPSVTVGKFVEAAAKKFGTDIRISRFTKFTMGEGLEKKTDNLAEEVAKMQNK
ncbi:MAG: translation elongation factor Ts [Firmicutes bacterium]|nr:translation elongation factor Ts [Bacillota bacterium]